MRVPGRLSRVGRGRAVLRSATAEARTLRHTHVYLYTLITRVSERERDEVVWVVSVPLHTIILRRAVAAARRERQSTPSATCCTPREASRDDGPSGALDALVVPLWRPTRRRLGSTGPAVDAILASHTADPRAYFCVLR